MLARRLSGCVGQPLDWILVETSTVSDDRGVYANGSQGIAGIYLCPLEAHHRPLVSTQVQAPNRTQSMLYFQGFLRQRCGHKRGRHQQLSCALSISHQARSYRRLPKRAIGFISALRVHRQDEYPKRLQVHLVPIDDAKLQQSVQVQTLPCAPPRCTLLHAHVLRCSKPSVGSKPLPPGTYSAGSSPHERTQQRDY